MTYLYNKLKRLLDFEMVFKTTQKVPEIAVYLIIWLVIFIVPVLVNTSNSSSGIIGKQVLIGWGRLIPFVAIFVINTVWLLPRFLFKGKTALYLLSVVIISLLLVFVWESVFPIIRESILGDQLQHADPQRQLPDMPRPGIQRPGMPNQPPHHPGQPVPRMNQPVESPRNIVTGIFNQMILAWLVVGLNTALKVTNKWFIDEQKKRSLEKEHLKSELAFLQNQISPHFFMNTLNNIHAQIDIDTKEAQSSIVTLSKMMRYLLYESDKGNTNLKREIEFLRSYVDLMKLRVDEDVKINLKLNVENEDLELPPLLFISFVENAFKHGISYNEKSFINITLVQQDGYIVFETTNSVSIQNKITSPYSGVGLENIKKRLNLLYNKDYQLDIKETDSDFTVYLKLPIHENKMYNH